MQYFINCQLFHLKSTLPRAFISILTITLTITLGKTVFSFEKSARFSIFQNIAYRFLGHDRLYFDFFNF